MEINILEEFLEVCDEKIFRCINCGVCSASCPISKFMELTPQRVIFYLINNKEEVLTKNTIWLCASCLNCQARCRKDIDFSRIADALRHIYLREMAKRKLLSELEIDKIKREVLVNSPQQLFIALQRKFVYY
ncbi:MAG: 4Fe-4S dicluster domain-containing protein [candidate division WOR-3 bacterium]|nr:4Fe-4S dicluster domain-containing protein [candidate division WOR-3 bacterium]MCX7837325.1 4Fe-4S dicluster domain-containing protein [candidate division WOR-3 bacterium]MDW8114612.1 4Fe-4S dicluster domain-containing protein [candidate division WOR-3 bacterium]